MTKKLRYSEGDILIILNKETIGTTEDRKLMQEYTPYTIESVTESTGSVYINIYGKEVLIFNSDLSNEDSIQIIYLSEELEVVETPNPKLNDLIEIKDVAHIEGAEKLGFKNNEIYTVIEEIENLGILIENKHHKLLIKNIEFDAIQIVNFDNLFRELEVNNVNNLIDNALANKDENEFNKLHELYRSLEDS